MLQRLGGPDAVSAATLAKEVGVAQSTLSRWKRQSATILDMSKKKSPRQPPPPNARSAEEKLRLVLEASRLTDDELGAFLRREGIHESHLESWRQSMLEALSGSAGAAKRSSSGEAKRVKALERELRRKEKALAETAALLVLKKKAEAIWGDGDDGTGGKSDR